MPLPAVDDWLTQAGHLALMWDMLCDSDDKESTYNAGYPGSIPGSGIPPGEGNGNPTLLFLPGESHGQRRLEGYRPWGHKEWDMAEQLNISSVHFTVLQSSLWDQAGGSLGIWSHPCFYFFPHLTLLPSFSFSGERSPSRKPISGSVSGEVSLRRGLICFISFNPLNNTLT